MSLCIYDLLGNKTLDTCLCAEDIKAIVRTGAKIINKISDLITAAKSISFEINQGSDQDKPKYMVKGQSLWKIK